MRLAAKTYLTFSLALNVFFLLVSVVFYRVGLVGGAIALLVILWNIVALVPRRAPRRAPRAYQSLDL